MENEILVTPKTNDYIVNGWVISQDAYKDIGAFYKDSKDNYKELRLYPASKGIGWCVVLLRGRGVLHKPQTKTYFKGSKKDCENKLIELAKKYDPEVV